MPRYRSENNRRDGRNTVFDLMNDRPLTFQVFPDEFRGGLDDLPGFLRIPWLTDDGFFHDNWFLKIV